MAKKIRREIMINGTKRWISGNTEQEYAERLVAALAGSTIHDMQFAQQKHNFRTYAKNGLKYSPNRLLQKSLPSLMSGS